MAWRWRDLSVGLYVPLLEFNHDEGYSTDKDMNDCSLIQLKEKDESHLPPAGLVYFPPPPPRGSRLQRVTPLRLHRISGDTPDTLVQFFEDVRGAIK
jgi:hypothetical protein